MAVADHPIEYRHRPFLCGVIGVWTAEALHRLIVAGPPGLVAVPTPSRARLFATDPDCVRHSSSGHSWTAAAGSDHGERLSAGLSWDDRSVTLRADALGLNELYYRRIGRAVFFASRIVPLLAAGEGKLTTDWEAWADVMAFGYPLADRTPFRQVRRMTPGSGWTVRDGSDPQSETRSWPFTSTDLPVAPSLMAAIVSRNIPRVSRRRPIILLSGGWDSRMLAGLARTRSLRRPVAWTTSPDDGWDHDVSLADPVARSLRLTHRVHIPDGDAFRRHATTTRRRVQYQTYMHTWLSSLAGILSRTRAPLIDGLAGDVLLKSLFVGAHVAEISDRQERMNQVRASLSVQLDDRAVFSPAVGEFVLDASRAGFSQAIESIPDMPGDATVAVLITRTMRGIASSPLWVFGPENDVRLPFVDPAVITAALTVPIAAKAGGEYYRQVLIEACPRAAALPSTNDPLPDTPRGSRRQSNMGSLSWMSNLVRTSEDAIRVLTPGMQQAVLGDDPEELGRLGRLNAPLRMLQVASMLAQWQIDYGAVLGDVGRAPWTNR